MNDREQLLQSVYLLVEALNIPKQSVEHAKQLLAKTQNAETCDVQPAAWEWRFCKQTIEAVETMARRLEEIAEEAEQESGGRG